MATREIKSLIERKLENVEYRKRHEETYEAFKLEAQILFALEKRGWSYSNLAEATKTSKSNVSRDLKAGGILHATFSRIGRIADALGMKLIALLIPKEQAHSVLPKIEAIVSGTFSSAGEDVKIERRVMPLNSTNECLNVGLEFRTWPEEMPTAWSGIPAGESLG